MKRHVADRIFYGVTLPYYLQIGHDCFFSISTYL